MRAALKEAPRGSSPGPTGLPFEFYSQNVSLLAPSLCAAYNTLWDAGRLPPSLAASHVRLLFKDTAGTNPSSLTDYRPISLRNADYRLLSRILVRRLNPLLPSCLPPSQLAFIPGRRSEEGGRFLRFLIEYAEELGLPHAAFLSLDQEKAYDLVDREWIIAVYRAFGAPPRLLSLLLTLYASTSLYAQYIINGFLSPGFHPCTGVPQGDPLSCISWILLFAPFVDALTYRRIALTLPSPIPALGIDTLTTLTFADDANLLVSSISSSLPLLSTLAHDWHLATNGCLNTLKTTATAIGPAAKDDAEAGQVRWTEEGEYALWAGFPVCRGEIPLSYYSLLLDRIKKR